MEHAYWKQMIEIEENGIFLVFGITRNDQIKFLHFSSVPQAEDMSVVRGIFHARDKCDRQRICPYRNAGRRMNAG